MTVPCIRESGRLSGAVLLDSSAQLLVDSQEEEEEDLKDNFLVKFCQKYIKVRCAALPSVRCRLCAAVSALPSVRSNSFEWFTWCGGGCVVSFGASTKRRTGPSVRQRGENGHVVSNNT